MTVVPFQGEVVPALREPRESVITALEEALEAARSGAFTGSRHGEFLRRYYG